MSAAVFLSADEVWLGGWRGPSLLRLDGNRLDWVSPLSPASMSSSAAPSAHLPGTIFGGFTDSHVHLGLVDPSQLVAGGIARVVDLGGDPAEIVALQQSGGADASVVDIEFAGAFLTAPGGYPSDRSWAPASSIREVDTPQRGGATIAELRDLGATRIKIALNSAAGPVWDDGLLTAIVTQAHAAGLPVVAHTEGPGQVMRAARAGVDTLAHTPWTERLSDADLADLARTVAITSTLDIHGYGDYGDDYAVALDNLARFVSAGGCVLYGTDLGNGPLPVGINERELAGLARAGLDSAGIAAALVPAGGPATPAHSGMPGHHGSTARPDPALPTPASPHFDTRISWIPGTPAFPTDHVISARRASPTQRAIPTDPPGIASWFASSTVLAVASLKELFA